MFQKLIKNLAFELNQNKIPYIIIGGQAVLLYGEPRLTKDIDITLGFGPENLKEVNKIVYDLSLKILVKNAGDFVNKTMVLPVIDEKSGIKIDFIFSFTHYEKQAIKRAKKVKILGYNVNFASLEDLLIHKIISGRERDIEDTINILLKNRKFNKPYINKWLKEFDKSLNSDYLGIFRSILEKLFA